MWYIIDNDDNILESDIDGSKILEIAEKKYKDKDITVVWGSDDDSVAYY